MMTIIAETQVHQVDVMLIPIREDSLSDDLASFAAFAGLPVEVLSAEFKAEKKEYLTFYHLEMASKVILVGMGKHPTSAEIRDIIRSIIHKNKLKWSGILGVNFIDYQSFKNIQSHQIAAFIEGFRMGRYQLGKYKQPLNVAQQELALEFFVTDADLMAVYLGSDQGVAVAEGTLIAMNLIDEPSNKMNALHLADTAKTLGESFGIEVRVMHKEEIQAQGLHGLLAVNQGSTIPPTFTLMEYRPKSSEGVPTVGITGKGVSFDTGGISIKSSTNMWLMKSDMSGAAIVIGTMIATAMLGLPVRVVAAIPATDNMPDGNAFKPSDVIGSYAGLSIEVEDTDAEGRLLLADSLAYLNRNYHPDILIDIATLTGGSIVALGYHAGALFSNNDQLAQDLLSAGQATGDSLWRLPLWEVYAKSLRSDVADVKNIGGAAASAITAAKFLEKFVENHPAWAHLDVAGMVFQEGEYSLLRSATGYGVRLLVDYLQKIKS